MIPILTMPRQHFTHQAVVPIQQMQNHFRLILALIHIFSQISWTKWHTLDALRLLFYIMQNTDGWGTDRPQPAFTWYGRTPVSIMHWYQALTMLCQKSSCRHTQKTHTHKIFWLPKSSNEKPQSTVLLFTTHKSCQEGKQSISIVYTYLF